MCPEDQWGNVKSSEMKVIDATLAWGNIPAIGKKKEKWLWKCDYCRYEAIFILYEGDGMSTACDRCKIGSMERRYVLKTSTGEMNEKE